MRVAETREVEAASEITREALKLALGIGESLVGRLLLFDALAAEFNEVQLRRDPECPVCGETPTITDYVDYVEFCAGTRDRRAARGRRRRRDRA